MDVIEKYLYAVGRRLPIKQREDIVKELRSVIMDNLDDRMQGKEPADEDINQVLLEMGAPYEVAKKYKNFTHLIGPQLIEPYLLVLKIVIAAIVSAYLISIIVSLIASGCEFASLIASNGDIGEMVRHVINKILNFIPGILSAVGAVTIVFAILDRIGGKKTMGFDEFGAEKWHPSKLEDVPQKDDIVKPIESIIGIVFTLLAIIIFNFYSAKLGIYYTQKGSNEWIMIGLSRAALSTYIPIWTVAWTLSLALHAWLLGIGKHNVSTRVFELFVNALDVGILFFMANGPVLFDIDNGIHELKFIADFAVNNHHTIFIVLGVLTLLGFLVNLVKFIVRQVKSMSN